MPKLVLHTTGVWCFSRAHTCATQVCSRETSTSSVAQVCARENNHIPLCYRCVHMKHIIMTTKFQCATSVCTWETHQAPVCYRCVHVRNTLSSTVLQVCAREKHTKLQCATGVYTWETHQAPVYYRCVHVRNTKLRCATGVCTWNTHGKTKAWFKAVQFPARPGGLVGWGPLTFSRGRQSEISTGKHTDGHWCINTTTTTTRREANTSLESLICIQCHTHFDWRIFSLKLFVF